MIEVYYTQIKTAELTRGQLRSSEHRAGMLLLELALKMVHGVKKMPEIGLSEHGKPYLNDGSYEFNISHSHGRIVLALSDAPIGIDIERADREVPQLVVNRFFKDGGANAEEWTKFESYCKLKGEGIYSASYPPHEKNVHFHSYMTDDHYVVSVCSGSEDFPPDMIRLEIES